ncbi:hypothetical protein CWR43_00270 [Rhizobium sullae]|uniref:Uncharacterized protein n=1 Tax=Rhizobium sullae TaxID=50338 RepID=A0A2N0DHC9_RHISU|nr:hypothetical protein CWR43_00270 [Rhizobium sullae]
MTYRRTSRGSIHVRGFVEVGTTTTLDTYHFALEAIARGARSRQCSLEVPAPRQFRISGTPLHRIHGSGMRQYRPVEGPGPIKQRASGIGPWGYCRR